MLSFLERCTIRTKLIIATAGLLVLFGAVGGFSVLQLSKLNKTTRAIGHEWLPVTALLAALNDDVVDYTRLVLLHTITLDAEQKDAFETQLKDNRADAVSEIAEYKAHVTTAEEASYLARFEKAWAVYLPVSDRVLALSRAGDIEGARGLVEDELAPLGHEAAEALEVLTAVALAEGRRAADVADARAAFAWKLIVGVLAVAVLFGAFSALLILRGITGAIDAIVRPMSDLARGELAVEVPFRGRKTEVGQIADAVEVFKEALIENRRVGQALALARDQAEAANRAKTEFLANMSHEIRTPLNGVLGLVDVLANTELSDTQSEMVRVINGSAETLERLLRDLLDFARLEAGRIEIENEPFHLGEVLRAAAASFATGAQEKGVEMRVEIDALADDEVRGDAKRIEQIVDNLLSNALKFTPQGSVTLRAGLADGRPSVFFIAVQDTGMGFEPSCKERLFARFEQGDGSATRRFGGSGLGLPISRQLAELMGGRLDAQSEPGRGSVFTLELPLQRVASAADPEIPAGGRRLRVLLADDHPTNQKLIELMLHAVDAQLTCVADGEQAVEAALREGFDLVLMDMQMPVLDGLSAIRRIREHERAAGAARTPIYTLSGHVMGRHEAAAMAAGADRHLTKPINAATLITALAELNQERTAQAAA